MKWVDRRMASCQIRFMRDTERESIERYADLFKALSNPNRLTIFLRIVSCCVPGTVLSIESKNNTYLGDMARNLEIAPSTVSHHIKELRRAGLIKIKRSGQKIESRVDPGALKDLEEFFKVKKE